MVLLLYAIIPQTGGLGISMWTLPTLRVLGGAQKHRACNPSSCFRLRTGSAHLSLKHS